jgi:hypothetical protein
LLATSPNEVLVTVDAALFTAFIVALAALEAAPVSVLFIALIVALVALAIPEAAPVSVLFTAFAVPVVAFEIAPIVALVALDRFDIICAMAKVVEPSTITETIVVSNKDIFPFISPIQLLAAF